MDAVTIRINVSPEMIRRLRDTQGITGEAAVYTELFDMALEEIAARLLSRGLDPHALELALRSYRPSGPVIASVKRSDAV